MKIDFQYIMLYDDLIKEVMLMTTDNIYYEKTKPVLQHVVAKCLFLITFIDY